MKEHWRPIHGLESLYQVSNLGQVKSTKCNDRILKQIWVNENWKVKIKDESGSSIRLICKYIALEAFGADQVRIQHLNQEPEPFELKPNKKVVAITSKEKGVNWCTVARKWQASVVIEGKRYNLGYFVSERRAAKAYKDILSIKKVTA